jgi:predicted nucleotidyltransferase
MAIRLSEDQITSIRQAATEVFGAQAQVWLFGSRVDDQKRGGDIDLLIRPDPRATDDLLRRKIRFLGLLERRLGERRIDVIIEHSADPRPIEQIARETGVKL